MKLESKLCKCVGCKYYKILGGWGSGRIYYCSYAFDTGKLRGIPPIDCYKHKDTPYTPKREGERNVKRLSLY